ncbi:RHD protein, partial [Turnix velox]|nr:RHD protein [Turnix velox]
MPSQYRSFRNSLPYLILSLEAIFILLFYFLFPNDVGSWPLTRYPAFQDVNHMVIFGFGFFLTFLRRYGFSSTGFNLLVIVLGVQYSLLTQGLFNLLLELPRSAGLASITKAVLSMAAVAISSGAVLGKTNPLQLILMTVVEIIAFHLSKFINRRFLQVPEDIGMMHVLLFGAYFGLAASWCFSEPPPRCEKNMSTPKSTLFSMLGTLFLWVFWPSFNSVLSPVAKWRTIYNTYFALAVSAVMAFVLSAMTSKDGKLRMAHIHSSVLAGGVALSYTADRIKCPGIAMILGLLASSVSILGSHCSQRCFNPPLKLHDSSGIHFTFGLPAVLGALAQVILLIIENEILLPSLGYRVVISIGAFCVTISIALITGLITGLILNLRLFKTIPTSKYFEDQFYWEVSFSSKWT